MSTKTILERFQLCWSEVAGVLRAYTYEPELPIQAADLPAVYPVTLGRQRAYVAEKSPGFYTLDREYMFRVLIVAAQMASTESGDLGAYIDELTIALIDAPTDYFMAHPRLETATLPALTGLLQDLTIQDSGPVMRLGPGGAQYRAIDYTFTIQERRRPTIQRLA
jgi:hypothetical protein